MKFTASRLSQGNQVFPPEIIIEEDGLTVKVPGVFSGQSKYLDYLNIGEVSVDAPLVGYSTITFYTAGTKVSAHGFTSSEVKQIKAAIEEGKSNFSKGSTSRPVEPQKTARDILDEAETDILEYELEQRRKHDNSRKPWLNDENFYDKSSIRAISFPNDVEDIEKTVEKIISAGIKEVKEVLDDFETTLIQDSIGDRNFFKPYSGEFEMVETCMEKAYEGIKKLHRKDDRDHPKIKYIINDLEESYTDLAENWFPQLEEQRAKKKRKNILVVVGIVVANILFWGGLWLFSK